MHSFFFTSMIAVMLLLGRQCGEEQFSERMPDCIREKIDALAKEPVRNPPAKVYRYRYSGQTVYYIPAWCCDFPSELYDSNCTLICSPDGGFSGRGDGRCTDFADTKTHEVLIWEDDREWIN